MGLSTASLVCKTRRMKLEMEHSGHRSPSMLTFWSRALSKAFYDAFGNAEAASERAGTSAWASMVAAASEELGDETVFKFQVSLPPERTYDDLARVILIKGTEGLELKAMVRNVSAEFRLTEKESLTAIDRTLGGMFRAMTGRADARPSADVDPVAAAAFDISLRQPWLMDAICPGWPEWVSSSGHAVV